MKRTRTYRHAAATVLAILAPLAHSPAEAAQPQSAARITIDAPADRVWQLLTQIDNWPRWNSAVDSAALSGPLAPGSVFVWKSRGFQVTSTLQDVEPRHRLTWTGVAFGTRAFHSWDIREADGHVVVSTFETLDGWLPWLLTGTMQKTLDETLPAWLQALKVAAERANRSP